MSNCPSCGRLLSVHSAECLHCGHDAAKLQDDESVQFADDGTKLVTVARFNNSAEAGYFADELAREENLEASLISREHFDALTGRWSANYLLAVGEPTAERAAKFLQSLLQEVEEDGPDQKAATAMSRINWWPIVLTTLAAGSAAYWGVGRAAQNPKPPALIDRQLGKPEDLWKSLSNANGPWIQRLGDDGVQALWVDPDGDSAVIHIDRDGDGIVDDIRRFRLKH